MKEAKKKDIELDLHIPRTSIKNKSGDKMFNNSWSESWGKIYHNLTVSINSGKLKWNDKYALYSCQNIVIKTKDDFIDAIIVALGDHDLNIKKKVKKITFTIKVECDSFCFVSPVV